MILPMGAEHTDHDKLITIVNTIEDQSLRGLFDSPIVRDKEYDRVNSLYLDVSHPSLIAPEIKPKYRFVEFVDEEKIDGFSYTSDNGEMYSRKLSEAKGSEGAPICKSGHVPQISRELKKLSCMVDFDIHGELFKVGGTSDDVTRIMGCSEDKAIARQYRHEDKLHYMVHDIMRFNGKSLVNEPWYVRRAILEYWYTYQFDKTYIQLSQIIGSPIKAFHNIVCNGGEGLMLKRTSGLYISGKKPANNWIKCKKEVTLDVVIMGLDYNGSGKNKDLFRSIEIGLWDPSIKQVVKVGNVHSGISDQLRRDMYERFDEYYKGKVIEVDAMDYNGKTMSLRHAHLVRFRDNKSVYDCTPDGLRIKTDLI